MLQKFLQKEVDLNFKKALQINQLGTKNIVKALKFKKQKPNWVFFASTSHVYKLNKKNLRRHKMKNAHPLNMGLPKSMQKKKYLCLKILK